MNVVVYTSIGFICCICCVSFAFGSVTPLVTWSSSVVSCVSATFLLEAVVSWPGKWGVREDSVTFPNIFSPLGSLYSETAYNMHLYYITINMRWMKIHDIIAILVKPHRIANILVPIPIDACKKYYRSIPRIRPPFLHASMRQNRGGGLCAGSWYSRVTTITDRWSPRRRAISVLLLAIWWIKLEKNDKVSFDMTYSYGF